jgi:nitrate reductase NapE component
MAQSTHVSDFNPEEGVREIQAERRRRSWLAAVLFAVCAVAFVGAAHLSYRDVPAPENPAHKPALR